MSTRWPGGIINGTAPVPTGGGAGDLAPGVWTIDQADQYIATQTWPGTGTPDPQFQYVTALLHGDGTNGGQNNTFLDSSSNNFTITRNGNTTQGSFSPYGDLWSNFFNGSSNLVTSASQVIPSGSYTLEAWVFVTSTSATQTIFAQGTGTGDSARTFLGIEDNSGAKWAVQIGGTQAISTITPALNVWTHVAMTFNGSTMVLYLNGTSIATASSSTNASNTTLQLGKNWGTYWFNGYISNARVSNTVRYTATFTPQTTPFVADANTVFLSCQANRFIDASTNNYALSVQNGTPSVQRFSPFQNLATYTPARVGGSGYFDGSGDYLSLPDNAAFDLGVPSGTTNDFTLEAWIYPVAFNTAAGIMGSFNDGSQTGYRFVLDSTGSLRVNIGSSFSLTSASSTVVLNQWQHIAVTRTSNNVYIYYNGTRVASGTSSNAADAPSNFFIGRNAVDVDNWYFPGYISNARVLKGTAQYTASTYTVPTAPFTAVSGTSLLTNFTNGSIFDSDATNNLETVGNAQISTSVVKFGTGSMYFDGSGDVLSTPYNPAFNFSGNFTIECWVYFNSLSSIGTVWSQNSGGTFFILHSSVSGSNALGLYIDTLGGSPAIQSSALSTGVWYHVALSRAGGTFRLFVNGNLQGTFTNTGNPTPSGSPSFFIGNNNASNGAPLNGYIDDLRITVGYARYWYNFQPPTAPFPNYGGVLAPPVQDPLFDYNTLLLNGDGTNGAQNNTFLDSSTNNFTITRNGNTTQGSFSPYGTFWSNFFGSSSQYLTTPSNSAFNMGSGDFTIEGWVYVTTFSSQYNTVVCQWNSSPAWFLYVTATGVRCGTYISGSVVGITGNAPVSRNTWNHVAGVRNGSTLTVYLNGVSIGSTSISGSLASSSDAVSVAILGDGSGNYNSDTANIGYTSNVRVIKGTALYTSNFTPSTTPFTAVSGTSLLTCQSNRFVDNSTNNFTLTPNGSPSVQRFSPFNPTAPYSTSIIGGSGYFDGSGDYLTSVTNAAFNFGSGAFTIEAFYYTTSTGNQVIVSAWNGSGGGNDSTSAFEIIYFSGVLYCQVASGTSATSLTTSTWPVNQWNHVVLVANGSTMSAYLNGTRFATTSFSSAVNDAAYAPQIGTRSPSSSFPFAGYIASARIVKGTAVYDPTASTLTVPTTPLTAITNTSLLTNFTNAGIPDLAMMADWETVGNAQVSTAQSKYGSGSLYFDGTGDYLITTDPTMSPLYDVRGQFTVECWVYLNNNTNGMIFTKGGGAGSWSTSNGHEYLLFMDSGTFYWMWNNGGSNTQITATPPPTGVWTHIAATYDGTTTRLFFNGNIMGTSTTGYTLPTTRNRTIVGINPDLSTSPLNGYIDDLRVTNGIARYVQPFTPPTQALQTF